MLISINMYQLTPNDFREEQSCSLVSVLAAIASNGSGSDKSLHINHVHRYRRRQASQSTYDSLE